MSDNRRGAILMNVAMLAFTLNDTCMKLVTTTLPLFQAITLRGVLTTAALLILARWQGVALWPPVARDRRIVALRSGAEVLATVTFLVALTQMPLANLSALMQSLPLAVTLAAVVFLRDPIGWRRMVAIMIGFAGVLLIIKPGAEGFDRWSLLGLASVLCVVVRDLSTRAIGATVSSTTVAVWAGVAVTLLGLVGSIWQGWQPVEGAEAGLIFLAAANLIVGYLTVVMTMRVGDVGFVAPFRYMALLWAIVLGFAVFGAWPDLLTLIGALIVVATGIFTFLRGRAAARP
ncbi:membrane protein [Gemmobacter lanyuensis]|uniref:Membrane protein n=1 Tax=Gemmobacter lanyuensis TaxID=1054497 RepID=A0A918IU22_9RHOB|nr:DMT family transporter [Gemmobacter lanyuensis]GGW32020.1 membrane protein [Gemmobacter lanyuensis]